ncbi:hypothetical protein LCGC14_1939000, partial [marine sediment metagenome]
MKVNKVYQGDCLEVMAKFPDNSIDTVITDPPYGLKFMSKNWDHGIPGVRFWEEILRVAKPGATLMAFGGSRTHHRLMVAIEDAGWEIRDCMMWLYAQGFPKSHDIGKALDKAQGVERKVVGRKVDFSYDGAKRNTNNHIAKMAQSSYGEYKGNSWEQPITIPLTPLAKQFDGYGTALKPAWEPIIVAQKPIEGTYANNAEVWGVAGLNIDGGRVGVVPTKGDGWRPNSYEKDYQYNNDDAIFPDAANGNISQKHSKGRFPANLILSHSEGCVLRGAKRVKNKGGVPDANTPKNSKPSFLGADATTSTVHHFDDNGYETTEDWDCEQGEIVKTETVIWNGIEVSPLDSLERLFEMKKYLIVHLSQLKDVPYSHTQGTHNLLDYEIGYAVGLSELPSFRVCCPACRHLYDGLAQMILEIGLTSSQQLSDVLKFVYHFLDLQAYTHEMLDFALRSNLDDFQDFDSSLDILLSNMFAECAPCENVVGKSYHIQDKVSGDLENVSSSDSSDENKIPGSFYKHRRLFGSACIDTLYRLFFVLTYRTSLLYLPITLYHKSIELATCAVRLLDEQSGELKSGARNGQKRKRISFGENGTFAQTDGDTG